MATKHRSRRTGTIVFQGVESVLENADLADVVLPPTADARVFQGQKPPGTGRGVHDVVPGTDAAAREQRVTERDALVMGVGTELAISIERFRPFVLDRSCCRRS
jgi:hypothetical protein